MKCNDQERDPYVTVRGGNTCKTQQVLSYGVLWENGCDWVALFMAWTVAPQRACLVCKINKDLLLESKKLFIECFYNRIYVVLSHGYRNNSHHTSLTRDVKGYGIFPLTHNASALHRAQLK